jgi:hypothetical protein
VQTQTAPVRAGGEQVLGVDSLYIWLIAAGGVIVLMLLVTWLARRRIH